MRIVSRRPSEAAPARMAPLSVLPVFIDLGGRPALVAGGSDAAAWKAELLAAAGAKVTIHAPVAALGAEMRGLIERDPERYTHRDARWNAGVLAGAAFAVADAETDGEAEAFAKAARAAGVPANVIDRPEFCQFQFGSIVNRSPVVVAVSTHGAAPVLAQAIRRRIETLLPPALADWAALAARLREAVAERLSPGPRRRAFWERFVDRAFGPAPEGDAEARLIAEAERIVADASGDGGRVTLVGAGPGDAGLITLKAVRAMQAADVILFDDLVSDEVLELARREARRILVGKRGGRESCRQEEINALMVKLARAGKRVVRLKSGDPAIFGRAGEEIERLEAEGVPVDIVPGVTAATAMAAALGVSLTHRDHARSVRFVTAHSKKGGLPEEVDWRAIADPSATTVFYMGGRMAATLAGRLIDRGLPGGTAAAVGAGVSRPGERLRHCTLETLAATVAELGLDEPVIIGVGAVFAPRQARVPDAAGSPKAIAPVAVSFR